MGVADNDSRPECEGGYGDMALPAVREKTVCPGNRSRQLSWSGRSSRSLSH